MPHQEKDRRKAQRSATSICCWTVSLDSFYSGRIDNLSKDGLFINTSKDIPMGAKVSIEFLPPNTDNVVRVESQAVWMKKDKGGNILGIGVEFVKLSREDKEVISFYLDIMRRERDERT